MTRTDRTRSRSGHALRMNLLYLTANHGVLTLSSARRQIWSSLCSGASALTESSRLCTVSREPPLKSYFRKGISITSQQARIRSINCSSSICDPRFSAAIRQHQVSSRNHETSSAPRGPHASLHLDWSPAVYCCCCCYCSCSVC